MKWTDMVAVLGFLAFGALMIPQCQSCVHQQDEIKLECMKAGKSEAECRFPH